VAEIIVPDGAAVGVRVESRRRQDADIEFTASRVVSDAGAFTTFCHLQSVPIPFRADLERVAAGHGFVTLYLAFKENPARLGFRGENHWIYDGYDHDALFKHHGAVLDGRDDGWCRHDARPHSLTIPGVGNISTGPE
jgi:hypothetical protein